MNIEQQITAAWYKKRRWIYIFTPLELIYRGINFIRKSLYQKGLFKSSHPGIPVIVVGNITVGGTGKTPIVIEIVNYLKTKGWKPGIVSRGYGGNKQDYPYLVKSQYAAEECGDEPVLLFRNTAVNIAIDNKRSRAAELLKSHGCNIIVTDDGLQHLALSRDYQILIVDGQRGFGNKHLLPVGPLREPLSKITQCDLVLTNGEHNRCPAHPASDCFSISATHLVEIKTAKEFPLSWLVDKEIHALAAIGNPRRFFSLLKELGAKPICHTFPDHHQYKMDDIPNDKKSLVVTEKDAVKLEQFNLLDCFYLKISAILPTRFYHNFDLFLEKMSAKYSKENS